MLNSMRNIYKYEGLTGFYKGMGFPLATVSLVNAVVFSTNETSKLLLGFRNENSLIEGKLIKISFIKRVYNWSHSWVS
jgi:hypothetical protein